MLRERHVNSDSTMPIKIDGEPHALLIFEEFSYRGSAIDTENGAQKENKARLNKARCAFDRLKNI